MVIDMLINNWDRVPLLWDHHGNPSNLLVLFPPSACLQSVEPSQVQLMAIDQLLCPIQHAGQRAAYHTKFLRLLLFLLLPEPTDPMFHIPSHPSELLSAPTDVAFPQWPPSIAISGWPVDSPAERWAQFVENHLNISLGHHGRSAFQHSLLTAFLSFLSRFLSLLPPPALSLNSLISSSNGEAINERFMAMSKWLHALGQRVGGLDKGGTGKEGIEQYGIQLMEEGIKVMEGNLALLLHAAPALSAALSHRHRSSLLSSHHLVLSTHNLHLLFFFLLPLISLPTLILLMILM